MKHGLAVISSDRVNLYGQRIMPGALAECLRRLTLHGMPQNISHDLSRPAGWSQGCALHFEPGCTRLVARTDFPETEDDSAAVRARIIRHRMKEVEEHRAAFDELRALLATALSAPTPLVGECASFAEPGLARQVFPDLFSKEDPDGLVDVRELKVLGPGVFGVGKLAVFAHSFFRRAQYRLNSLNDEFLSLLFAMPSASARPRVKLDEDQVGLASTYKERFELEYWWGPEFKDDLTQIPPGVTVHTASDTELLF